MPELLVPPGTKTQELIQMSLQRVVNGYVVNMAIVFNEAGREPYQAQMTKVFLNAKEALEEIVDLLGKAP